MNRKKALQMAIEALEQQAHKYSVDANLHEIYHADYPQAIRASEKRMEIREAIEVLKRPQVEQIRMFGD